MAALRIFTLLACGFALLACNENALHTFPDNNPPPLGDGDDDDDDDDDDGVDDDDTGGPYDDGNPDDDDVGTDDDDDDRAPNSDDDDVNTDDDDDDDEPEEWLDECPEDAIPITDFYSSDGGDGIYTLSWGPTEADATLEAPVAGMYAVYDTYVYESGGSQTNESGFIRIRNNENPDGAPISPNCGLDYIIQDSDNSGSPPAPYVYLGTFELVQGANELTLYHYCALYRQGYCGSFHIGDPDANSGCEGSGPNSIHLEGEGICLVPR